LPEGQAQANIQAEWELGNEYRPTYDRYGYDVHGMKLARE
jgi:hypothetical protein